MCEREIVFENEIVCVCVCVREKDIMCVCVCVNRFLLFLGNLTFLGAEIERTKSTKSERLTKSFMESKIVIFPT